MRSVEASAFAARAAGALTPVVRIASRRLDGAGIVIVQITRDDPEVLAAAGTPTLPIDLARALCERAALRGRLVELGRGDPDRVFASPSLPDAAIGLCLSLPLRPTPTGIRSAALCVLSRARPSLTEAERLDLEDLAALGAELLGRVRPPTLPIGEHLASLGTLAAGIAHQINNPIGAILNGAELALLNADEPDATELWRRALEDTIAQAHRCGRIVKSLVRLARADAMRRSVVDLGGLLRVAYAETRGFARERSAHLDFELLPESLEVRVMPVAMEQVFVSLVRAGIESREVGAVVVVSMARTGDHAVIRIVDNGRGVAAGPGDLLGESPTVSSADAGQEPGLGLSVLHGFIAEQGGVLEVDRRPGRGTTVIVRLPVAASEEQGSD